MNPPATIGKAPLVEIKGKQYKRFIGGEMTDCIVSEDDLSAEEVEAFRVGGKAWVDGQGCT